MSNLSVGPILDHYGEVVNLLLACTYAQSLGQRMIVDHNTLCGTQELEQLHKHACSLDYCIRQRAPGELRRTGQIMHLDLCRHERHGRLGLVVLSGLGKL